DPSSLQVGERDAVSLALRAEPERRLDREILEPQATGIGGVLAQLALDLVDEVARAIGRYDERADALLPCGLIGDGEGERDPGDSPRSDELLIAVEDVAGLRSPGPRADRRRVGACFRFGQRERA